MDGRDGGIHREADAITAALFRAQGEAGVAHLYLTDRRAFDRRMERGRQHFFGAPSRRARGLSPVEGHHRLIRPRVAQGAQERL